MQVRVRHPGRAAKRAGDDLRTTVTFHDDALLLPLSVHFLHVVDEETGERVLRNVGCELGEAVRDEESALAMPELQTLVLRRVVERYPHWLELARAHAGVELANAGDMAAGLKRVKPARLDPDWYRMIAAEYRHHLSQEDPAPVSAIARSHQVTVSAASRWVKGARERGMLDG